MNKPIYFFLLSLLSVLVLAACANQAPDRGSPEPYYLQADDATVEDGPATAEELSLQGQPIKISDKNASDGRAALLIRTGDTLAWTFRGEKGMYELRVRARGELYEGAPRMRVRLGGRNLDTETVGSETYKAYTFGAHALTGGERVSVTFTNDKWGGSRDKDRNLAIDHIWLKPILTEAPSVPSTDKEPSGGEVGGPKVAIPGAWSDPDTWGGSVPQDGDYVEIAESVRVTLDTDTASLSGLRIQGELVAADKDVALTSEFVVIEGLFQIGIEAKPYVHQATVTLTGDADRETPFSTGVGNKVLAVLDGGRLELHGAAKTGWTQLAATAAAGATSLRVLDASGWEVGDTLAVAPSDFDPFEAEEVVITALNGNTVGFSPALAYQHWGETETHGEHLVDMRAEVANLNRSIHLTSDAGAYPNMGGHLIFREGSQIRIDGTEVSRMGQPGKQGRYSVHFHLAKDMAGSYVRNSSIHHAYQRGLVIHQTDSVEVEDNVIFDVYGNGYYLEDSIEINNVFERNLAMLIRYTPREFRLSQPDGDDRAERLAAFWITNSANEFRDNHAVGVENGMGFWFTPPDRDLPRELWYHDSHKQPMREFSGNVAHTISFNRSSPDGGKGVFNLGYGPEEAGSCLRLDAGFPYSEGLDRLNAPVTNFLAYKCRNTGVWDDNRQPLIGLKVVDSRTGAINAQGRNVELRIQNSLILSGSRNNPPGRDMHEVLTQGPFGHTSHSSCAADNVVLSNTLIVGDIKPNGCG